jgi:hypothetical protein
MKPTMTIFACVLAAGLASAQMSPTIIQNTRDTMNGVRDNSAAASNAALGIQDKAPSKATATRAPAQSSGTAAVSMKSAATGSSKTGSSKTGASKSAGKTGAQKPTGVAAAAKKNAHSKVGIAPATKTAAVAVPVASSSASASGTGGNAAVEDQTTPDNKWNTSGKRDPFLSPVVSRAGNSGCSTGKKCLEIGTISLHGIVHSEAGFIAVVSNGLNKAYFLRENDPVFNGYVMKITGDSITFQETLQDRLGKTFTREVVKKITTPAV